MKTHTDINEVWGDVVLSCKNELGILKYDSLGKVVKVYLAFSHGNVEAKWSFFLQTGTQWQLTEVVLAKKQSLSSCDMLTMDCDIIAIYFDMIRSTRLAYAKYETNELE